MPRTEKQLTARLQQRLSSQHRSELEQKPELRVMISVGLDVNDVDLGRNA